MEHEFEKCGNCGAPLEAAADGRAVRCPYCGAAGRRALDPAQVAAGLRAESQTGDELFENLAQTLAREFPDRARLETTGGWLARKRLRSVEVNLEGALFRLRRGAGGLVAERSEVVRGIAVKTEPIPLDEWVEALGQGLSHLATHSAAATAALRRIAGRSS